VLKIWNQKTKDILTSTACLEGKIIMAFMVGLWFRFQFKLLKSSYAYGQIDFGGRVS
jgi:hypothetical protein